MELYCTVAVKREAHTHGSAAQFRFSTEPARRVTCEISWLLGPFFDFSSCVSSRLAVGKQPDTNLPSDHHDQQVPAFNVVQSSLTTVNAVLTLPFCSVISCLCHRDRCILPFRQPPFDLISAPFGTRVAPPFFFFSLSSSLSSLLPSPFQPQSRWRIPHLFVRLRLGKFRYKICTCGLAPL